MALDVESEVLAAIREVLGRSDVTVNDDFFEAGGSSFLVVRAIALLKDRGVRVPARSFIENSRVAAIAECAEPLV